MRAFVFTDAKLERHAGRFVWLSMNTEETSAGPFLEKFPVEGWPTLFVIDPRTEKVALKWPGAVTVPQFERLLDDGERAIKGASKGLDAQITALDLAYGQGKHEEAARLGAKLAAAAPKDWPGRPRAVQMWLLALYELKQWEPCAKTAVQEREKLPRAAAYVDVVNIGLGCASELPKDAPGRAALIAPLEKAAKELLAKRDIPIAVDDYSGLYGGMVDLLEERGDADGARATAEAWASYLEGEATKTTSPEARTVFDPHRMTAYLKLKQPERALSMLQASEQALPDDFNPPARLAVVYREMGKLDEALAATERALARARGPRKLRILSTRATILEKKGDVKAARKALDDALAFAATLPKSQQYEGSINSVKKQRDELKEPAPATPPAKTP
ncbi:MAG TPA: tetratricopeptide repeat protein [Myxococcaceae bacterium]|jgi:tetratricopeptide (TPR) repeat protein